MNNIYDPEFVKKLFNQMSSSYERMNYITSFGFSIRWRKQFLSKLGKSQENLEVMDLLSGLGENWTFLKHNFPNANFYALDFSENMIHHSKGKANRIFHGNLNLICDNMLENKLDSNHFDIISCAYGLKTFNEEQLNIIAKEIYRILKPNGKFSFVEVSKPKSKALLYFYSFYLGKIIPVLGKMFLGNSEDYKMLWIYTKQFENSKKVKEIFQRNNLKVNLDEYFGGCATGISGSKL
jgi:ubiquinone/menaquinone biosynthesis methyltransferase